MIEVIRVYETEKRSYLMGLLTAICEKALSGLCQYGMGVSPHWTFDNFVDINMYDEIAHSTEHTQTGIGCELT